jgi:lipoyl(octanoyl) transferase
MYCNCLRSCDLYDLHQHQIPYDLAWSWQKRIVADKKLQIQNEGDCSDALIILQHPPVFTLGTAAGHHNLNFDLNDPPFHIYRTERGGEVTFHGPGQVVSYLLPLLCFFNLGFLLAPLSIYKVKCYL